jgi:hypothetical protein
LRIFEPLLDALLGAPLDGFLDRVGRLQLEGLKRDRRSR